MSQQGDESGAKAERTNLVRGSQFVQLLRRLERRHWTFSDFDAQSEFGAIWLQLVEAEIVRNGDSATSVPCPDCGGERR